MYLILLIFHSLVIKIRAWTGVCVLYKKISRNDCVKKRWLPLQLSLENMVAYPVFEV